MVRINTIRKALENVDKTWNVQVELIFADRQVYSPGYNYWLFSFVVVVVK